MAAEDFRKLNVGFICEYCGREVKPVVKSSRNHCPYCLYSKHVDIVPGDRMEVCKGLMKPVDYDYKHGELRIIHRCIKCGKTMPNKSAPDDEIDQLLQSKSTGTNS